jgi:hypothetical protein
MGANVQWLINLIGKIFGLCLVNIVSTLAVSLNLKVNAKFVLMS